MDVVVQKVRKSATAEIWISVTDFQGRRFVNLREHFLSADDRQWHPTKKGIMLGVEELPQVIDGVAALDGGTPIGTSHTIAKGAKSAILIGHREFERNRYGEVRLWYSEGDSDEMKPSPKGVTFKMDLAETISVALCDAEDLLESGQR